MAEFAPLRTPIFKTEPERSVPPSRNLTRNSHIILLLTSVLAFCMWFYVDRVWAPPGEIHYSDLYPSWYGTRELLLHGRDPYGQEVSGEIQLGDMVTLSVRKSGKTKIVSCIRCISRSCWLRPYIYLFPKLNVYSVGSCRPRP